ncbi:MAG: tetratricopeptide repeat protein [Anaerolineae bacterium]|nr:tetratricopeptide repeat protein [Anaerolineae bacterium]
MLNQLRLWIVIAGILMLPIQISVKAQTNTANETIYIYNTADCDQHSDLFLTEVNHNLAQFGYEIEQVTEEEIENFQMAGSVFSVQFDTCFEMRDGKEQILISIVAGQSDEIKQISPILFPTFDLFPAGDVNFPAGSEAGENFSVSYITGAALYAANHCQDAVPFLEDALLMIDLLEPENVFYYGKMALEFYLGNCSVVREDYITAVLYYENGLITSGPFWQIRSVYHAINLSWVYLQTDDEIKAFEIADFALKTSNYWASVTPFWISFNLKVLRIHAQLNILASRFNDALADLNRAIQFSTNPEIVRHPSKNLLLSLYDLRGQMYRALYEWDSALADFNAALELDPAYAEAYYQRGLLYASILQTGVEFYDEALADFQHYLELAPEGEHAAEAAQYITDLQSQQQSLNN